VDGHGSTENTEDDVDAPLDVNECGWDKVGEGEVENLVMLVNCFM
jgi:hypothetical protein